MAKKSQTSARRNNTQAGRRVVNFYNFGTVNIDGRQNNSVTYKHDNRGSNIYYLNRPCRHRLGDSMPEILKTEGISNMQPVKPQDSKAVADSEKVKREWSIGKIGLISVAVGVGAYIASIAYKRWR